MKADKKYLIPVTAALAAFAGTGQAVESNKTAADEFKTEAAIPSALKNILGAGDKLATYTMGDELHALILRKNSEGIVLAGHYSHRSHSSHSSHSSHYSSR